MTGSTLVASLRRVEVAGPSMLPTLAPGDRLLALAHAPVGVGAIVAAREPGTGRLVCKRVAAVGPDGRYELRGDNAGASTDSRHWGPVPPDAIVGRIIWRYHPADASGRIPGP
ncbi:MAG: S26 family signal peptidase [Actinomycetota bacterium]|nr:S26 family signal peptidase [Actinomycetota bacterium]